MMMRLGVLAAALWAGAACGQPAPKPPPADPMAWAYDVTMEQSILAVGYYAERNVDADHTWRDTDSGGGLTGSGTWAMEGDKVCYTQVKPQPQAEYAHMCYAQAPRKVGDAWTNTDPVTGNQVLIRIVARKR